VKGLLEESSNVRKKKHDKLGILFYKEQIGGETRVPYTEAQNKTKQALVWEKRFGGGRQNEVNTLKKSLPVWRSKMKGWWGGKGEIRIDATGSGGEKGTNQRKGGLRKVTGVPPNLGKNQKERGTSRQKGDKLAKRENGETVRCCRMIWSGKELWETDGGSKRGGQHKMELMGGPLKRKNFETVSKGMVRNNLGGAVAFHVWGTKIKIASGETPRERKIVTRKRGGRGGLVCKVVTEVSKRKSIQT